MRDRVDVGERLAPYEAHRRPVASHGTSFDGLIWLLPGVIDVRTKLTDTQARTDLSDGRCTNHPARCMIPNCDHTREPQASRDRARWGADGMTEYWARAGR